MWWLLQITAAFAIGSWLISLDVRDGKAIGLACFLAALVVTLMANMLVRGVVRAREWLAGNRARPTDRFPSE